MIDGMDEDWKLTTFDGLGFDATTGRRLFDRGVSGSVFGFGLRLVLTLRYHHRLQHEQEQELCVLRIHLPQRRTSVKVAMKKQRNSLSLEGKSTAPPSLSPSKTPSSSSSSSSR